MALGPEKFPGHSRNGFQAPKSQLLVLASISAGELDTISKNNLGRPIRGINFSTLEFPLNVTHFSEIK